MTKIRLTTRSEGALVHESEIPPFNEAPAVIGWGDRVFLCQRHEGEGADTVIVYVECFAYALTDNPNT